MQLTVDNKVILTPLTRILQTLQSQVDNGKLKDIDISNAENIKVTCPNNEHKDGRESHPSCNIFNLEDNEKIKKGTAHCFACGYKANFIKFICDCFDTDDLDFGKEWLLSNSDFAFQSEVQFLPEIDLTNKKIEKEYLDESILNKYKQYHPYMWQRKLSKEIVDLFEVGYDSYSKCITFPVRDEYGKLLFITKRSVETKSFFIPKYVEKPVYLLYYVLQHKIDRVAVCESQINCLYAWSLGIPAIGLFGTGSDTQYEILKKSGIRIFDLMFDGDYAGRVGAYRFEQNMKDYCLINKWILPEGKDVNDLSYEQLSQLTVV